MSASDNADKEGLLEAGDGQVARELQQKNESGTGDDGTKVPQEGGSEGEGAAGEDEHRIPPSALMDELETRHDTHAFKESLWDAVIFLWMPHVGSLVSSLTTICILLNFILQTSFIFIVNYSMLANPLGTGDLNDLLHFRASASHSFKRADELTHESMARLICQDGGSQKAIMATGQGQLQQSALKYSFNNAGPVLAVLVQICWLGTVIKDLSELHDLVACLWKIRGERTQLSGERTRDDEISVKLTSISSSRFIWVMVTVVLPKLFIAVALGFVGVRYLANTEDMSDLVLNSLALAFVFELDELLFATLAPRRLRLLIGRMEPLKKQSVRMPAGMETALVLTGIAIAVSATYIFLIQPFAWTLGMAHHIVCGGNQDFVYVRNRATGMIHVAASNDGTASHGDWEQDELTILKEANLMLEDWYPNENNWNDIDNLIRELSEHNKSAMHEVGDVHHSFEVMSEYASKSITDISSSQTCEDLTSDDAAQSEAARVYLAAKLGLGNYSYACGDPLGDLSFRDACSMHDYTLLRASCPVSCGCSVPFMGDHFVAAFDSVHSGCPRSCESKWFPIRHLAWSLPDHYDVSVTKHMQGYVADMPNVSSLTFDEPSESLIVYKWIMKYFEGVNDFWTLQSEHARLQRSEVGVSGLLYYDAHFDSENFSMSTLCDSTGAPGRDPITCSEGMVEASDFVNHVASGELLSTILNGQWHFHPLVPHPRGLKGCDFFTSWELRSLLGLDLCSNDAFLASIRPICQEECGCKPGMSQCYSWPMKNPL
jgi:hypothetical protein